MSYLWNQQNFSMHGMKIIIDNLKKVIRNIRGKIWLCLNLYLDIDD